MFSLISIVPLTDLGIKALEFPNQTIAKFKLLSFTNSNQMFWKAYTVKKA